MSVEKNINYTYRLLDKKEIYKIKSLWEKLNEIHLKDSSYFKDHYRTFTFEKRCEKFARMPDTDVRIETVENNGLIIGYCISTINGDDGEVESLFVEENFRGSGIGNRLVENSINWLKAGNCKNIIVVVTEGHESVFGFYQKHKFFPRKTYLYMKG